MAPATSPFARNKSLRFTRSKTHDDATNTAQDFDQMLSSDAPTIRTTFSDLKNQPGARQVLRRQFSSTFQESASDVAAEEIEEPPLTAPATVEAPRPTFPYSKTLPSSSLTTSASLRGRLPRSHTAPTSLPTIVEPNRLSVVQESVTQIDVDQAINLLEQLKKTASPEQLVALHRALLPTKDVVTPVTPMFPPDALEIPSHAPPMRRSALGVPGLATRGGAENDVLRKPGEFLLKPVPAKARRRNRRGSQDGGLYSPEILRMPPVVLEPRSDTPELVYTQPGAYRYGSLRVTNGTASPEPSLHSPVSVDSAMTPETPVDPYGSRRNSLQNSLRRTSIADGPEKLDLAVSSDDPEQARHANTSSVATSRVSNSNDSPRVSPIWPSEAGLPDRQSCVSAHLSKELLTDYEAQTRLTRLRTDSRGLASPTTPKSIVTVEGSIDSEYMSRDARETALSRLNGNSRLHKTEHDKLRGNSQMFHGEPKSLLLEHPFTTEPQAMPKIDSGYSSDVAYRAQDGEGLGILVKQSQGRQDPYQSPLAEEQRKSFRDFLSSPVDSSDAKIFPANDRSERSSPTKLFRTKSPQASDLESNVAYHLRDVSISSQPPEPQAPVESKRSVPERQSRKLQKPMPAAVREQLEAESEAQAARSPIVEAAPVQPAPAIPDAVAESFARHSTHNSRVLLNGTEINLVPKTPSAAKDNESVATAKGGSTKSRSKSRGRKSETPSRSSTPRDQSPQSFKSTWSFARLRSKSRGRLAAEAKAAAQLEQDTTEMPSLDSEQVPYSEASSVHSSIYGAVHEGRSGSRQRNDSTPSVARSRHDSSASTSRPRQDSSLSLPRSRNDSFAAGTRPRVPASQYSATSLTGLSASEIFDRTLVMAASSEVHTGEQSINMEQSRAGDSPRPRTSHAEDSVGETFLSPKVLQAKRMLQERRDEEARRGGERKQLHSINTAITPKASHHDSSEVTEGMPRDQRWSIDKSINLPWPDAQPKLESLTHASQHPGWPGWETQVKRWRRQHLEALDVHEPPSPEDELSELEAQLSEPPLSASRDRPTAHGHYDRTDHARNDSEGMRMSPTHGAKFLASELIRPRTAPSTGTNRTFEAPPKMPTHSGTASANPSNKYNHSIDLERSRQGAGSPSRHSEEPAARPASRSHHMHKSLSGPSRTPPPSAPPPLPPQTEHSAQADRFRAKVAAKTSAAAMMLRSHAPAGPPPSFAAPSPPKTNMSPPLTSSPLSYSMLSRPSMEQTSHAQPRPAEGRPALRQNPSADNVDRYSNGFQYGWDREHGFTGSAGTRNVPGKDEYRKSKKMSKDFGVDLSDVPVFLRKV